MEKITGIPVSLIPTTQPNYAEMFSAARDYLSLLPAAEQKARLTVIRELSERMRAVLCESNDGLTTLMVLADFLATLDSDFRLTEQPHMKWTN